LFSYWNVNKKLFLQSYWFIEPKTVHE
jgi:hypothetical protein